MAILRFRLLGGCETQWDSGARIEIPIKKAQALLAYLALQSGKGVSRDKLASLLWSDRGDKQAQGSLRQSLTILRKALEPAEPSPLIVEHGEVSLAPSAVEVDAVTFAELIARDSIADLEAAAALYQGDLLDGFVLRDPIFEEWLDGARLEYREAAVRALTRLLDHKAANDERDEAIILAQRLLSFDPLQEAVHRILMSLYAAQGQRDAALQQFENCREILERELAVPPETETAALADQIRDDRLLPDEEKGSLGPVPEPTSSPAQSDQPAGASTSPGPSSRSWRLTAMVAGLALFLGLTALAWLRPWEPRVDPASEADMAFPLPDKPSIAVLPFTNMSGDPEQTYFADGMTDDLITGLSKVSGLFVISRHSTFTYKGKPVMVRQVAEELGVRYVLEGSVRRSGDQVRINAQLIDALTGYHLWAEKYDSDMADVFQLQDEVVGSIVSALAVSLSGDVAVAHAPEETQSPEAYDAYLQGKEFFRVLDAENTAKAISFFKRAVELDPDYHRAHAALATAYWRIFSRSWVYETGLTTTDAFDLIKNHLALALEGPTAEAFQTSAAVLVWDGQHQAALREINEAITLEPNEADNYSTKSWILIHSGHAKEAEQNALLAMRLNPTYPASYLRQLGRAQFHQDRFGEAANAFARVIQREPEYEYTYRDLAAAYGHLGRLEEAKSAIGKFVELRAGSEGGALTVQSVGDWTPFADESYRARLQEGLRKAGVPEGAAPQLTEEDYKSLVTKSGGEFAIEGVRKIDLAEAKSLHEDGALFIDVRSEAGYLDGHIPGAIGLDLKTQLTKESLADVAEKDRMIVFYCDGIYCYKSADACAKAITWGYTNVLYFAGGEPEWSKAGYPVTTN